MHALWHVDWEKIVRVSNALLTPLIAAVAIYIAYQQYLVNHRQHRLALFEKRMKVFNSTMTMIATIVRATRVELNELFIFLQETREHEFLFGPEIGAYINGVYSKGVELHARDFGTTTGRQIDIEKSTELLTWFSGQSAIARNKFLKYVDFRKP